MEAQGVTFASYFPIITDNIRMIYYATYYPNELCFIRMVNESNSGSKDGKLPQIAGMFVFGMLCVIWNKPEALDELYVTKNAFYTKHEIERAGARPLIVNSIVSMESDDPTYRKKRKALSGAFLKGKMDLITELVKKSAMHSFYDT